MNKGTLSFSVNDYGYNTAFEHPFLKVGPIYPAIALFRCAGCKLNCNA